MPNVKCSKCNGNHARPVGRKCTRPVVEAATITASTKGERSNVGTSNEPATASLPPQPFPPSGILSMFADLLQQLLTQVSTLVKNEVERIVHCKPSAGTSVSHSSILPEPLEHIANLQHAKGNNEQFFINIATESGRYRHATSHASSEHVGRPN